MKNTKIQWCHSTVNPVMGCNGCELWKPAAAITALILDLLLRLTRQPKTTVQAEIERAVGDRETSELYRDRESVAQDATQRLGLDRDQERQVIDVIRKECKCYAGFLGTMRAGHAGYTDKFEMPKLYPGRVAKAAIWTLPDEKELQDKPWLKGLPRLIFVSDIGDALSNGVSFNFLMEEIIGNVVSEAGQRHIWLWLSKRPGRMAEFGKWLQSRGIGWPANLVPMTTVTAQRFAHRVDQLRRVPSQFKGLSLEPLSEPVNLDLRGIDWTIVGGGSDVMAEPFHAEWALALERQCKSERVAFFLKQLGKHPFHRGKPLELDDQHGGNWNEWPKERPADDLQARIPHLRVGQGFGHPPDDAGSQDSPQS